MAGAHSRRWPLSPNPSPLAVAVTLPLLGWILLGAGQTQAKPPSPPHLSAPAPPLPPITVAQLEEAPEMTPPVDAQPSVDNPSFSESPEQAVPSRVSDEPLGLPEADGSEEQPATDAIPGQLDQPATPSPVESPATNLIPKPESVPEPRVLISEVVIEGLSDHPEREQLELETYGALRVSPGTEVTRSELRDDLAAVYDTGWFSDARIQPVDTPLGVRLVVTVMPNPVLTNIRLDPEEALIPETVVQDTFAADLGRTLNLKTLQNRMKDLQKWYADEGYSLARVTGPSRVSPDGEVLLLVRQGAVEAVEVQFLNKEGSNINEQGQPVKGKSKEWVVTREISLKPGQVFNRRDLEEDLKRLYGTGLFSDVKVSLKPVPANPGRVVIQLGMVEQSTGSLSGGLGYSQSQGVFGQIQLQDSNLFGRAWDIATSFTYGQFGGLADITFTDPWIKGDPFRTAFRAKVFISRDVPQIFQSQEDGDIYTVNDFYHAPGTQLANNINSFFNELGRPFASVDEAQLIDSSLSWFDYDGNSVVIQRVGGNFQFVRPLNGGNPYKKAPWSLILGLNAQQVTPMDFSGDSKRFALANNNFTAGGNIPKDSIICIAFNCANNNQLLGFRLGTTLNTLDDPRNPTSGNFLSVGTEQFFSIGPDSPTFNRLRGSFSHFLPVNWIRFYKGCRPKPGERTDDCKQALAFQLTAGTNIGDLPTYEAFCVGGGNSVRGYYDCDLGVGRSFGEATVEYRFPLFKIISGSLFIDAGTTFGSQDAVEGNPGELLDKPGQGFSVGTGVIVTTPVGPLRLEVASEDFSGEWRFNLGVGWKF